MDFRQLWPGQKVWKSDDPALTRRLRKSFTTSDIEGRALSVEIHVAAQAGQPLRLRVQGAGLEAFECRSADPLAEATKHPLTVETLEKQLSRLGGTGFVLRQLTASIEGAPMVPLSVLGQLRRDMVQRLDAARAAAMRPAYRLSAEPVLPQLRRDIQRPTAEPATPQLLVLCRSLHQLQTVLELNVPLVYVDFQDIRDYRQAVAMTRASSAHVYLATPRIQKPGEIGIFHALARQQADGILVRNLAGLEFFTSRHVPCVSRLFLECSQ